MGLSSRVGEGRGGQVNAVRMRARQWRWLWPRASWRRCEPGLAGAAGDAGGDVQDPVAEGVDFAAGQVRLIGEAYQFGPSDQICCCHNDFQPCIVGVESVEREVA